MDNKSQLLANTKSFPGSTVVTFDGKKITLDELRGGSVQPSSPSAPKPSFITAPACPRCKSVQTVCSGGAFACNSCGNTWQ